MKNFAAAALLGALVAEAAPSAHHVKVHKVRNVDTRYPYTGPKVPVGDWIDQSVNGNGRGFPRLVEPPAVKPSSKKPKNNINVISLSYVPNGVNIHYQTPFGLGTAPSVMWGVKKGYGNAKLSNKATGSTTT